MKIVKEQEAKKIRNSDSSELLEYSHVLKEKKIDFCINTIHGRYPEKGYCTNKLCKELCYILKGKGSFHKRDEEMPFVEGDVLLIDRGEIYYWERRLQNHHVLYSSMV